MIQAFAIGCFVFFLMPLLLRGGEASALVPDGQGIKTAWKNTFHAWLQKPWPATLGEAGGALIVIIFLIWKKGDVFLALAATAAVAQVRTDWRHGLLTDELTFVMALGAPAALWLDGLLSAALLGALGWFFARPYAQWRGREVLGMGDVKLLPVLGLWLPHTQLPLFLCLAGVFGVLSHAGAWLWQRYGGQHMTRSPTDDENARRDEENFFTRAVPFGPALLLAWAVCVG